jgi:ribosomal protein L12E/L44/L45/RPP1/RPP2
MAGIATAVKFLLKRGSQTASKAPRGTSAGRSVLNNRTVGQRIAAGTIAAGITGGITAGFLGSEQSDQSQTDILNQTTGKNKTEASNLNKKDLQIIKFPPDIENSPVPHVLIKIYETETGSVATTDLTATSFNAGVSEIAQKVEDVNIGEVIGALGGAKIAATPAGLLAVGGKWRAAAGLLAAGAAGGAALVGTGAAGAITAETIDSIGSQIGVNNTSERFVSLIKNFALKRNIEQLKVAIALLMPETLAVSYQNRFDELSFTQAAGVGGLLAQAMGSMKGTSGGNPDPYIIEAAGRVAQGLLTDDFKRIGLFATTGRTINPQPEMIYNAPTLREFTMDFRLVPKNQVEAAQINSVLTNLKYFAAPKIPTETGGRYFIPPAQFELEFYDAENNLNQFLFKTKKCVLEDISIDYTGNGSFATFYDGSPVETRLSLRFRETVFIDKNAVSQGY